jgi:hypothetical protein
MIIAFKLMIHKQTIYQNHMQKKYYFKTFLGAIALDLMSQITRFVEDMETGTF